MPTHNYGKYLREAVESVLSQDFRELEVLIADDASTDNTVEVCRSLVNLDSRVRFFQHNRTIGMVGNWNWCLEHARGTHIKFLLSNDRLSDTGALSRMATYLDEDPGITLVLSANDIIDTSSRVIGRCQPLGGREQRMNSDAFVDQYLDHDIKPIHEVGEPTVVMFRKADMRRGFSPKYRHLTGLEMWFFLLRKGDLHYVPESLCGIRVHAGRDASRGGDAFVREWEEVELCVEYAHREELKSALFEKMNRMTKDSRPEVRAVINRIKAEFTPEEYAYHSVKYALSRPLAQIRRLSSR